MESDEIFCQLRTMLSEQSQELVVVTDEPDHYYLDTQHMMKNKKPLFFAAVKINKRYVSFHLMPVYVFPALLDGISKELKKRMQGKSCFNFTQVDEVLFRELKGLVQRAKLAYQDARYIPSS